MQIHLRPAYTAVPYGWTSGWIIVMRGSQRKDAGNSFEMGLSCEARHNNERER